jgi:hypothetical protein
MSILRNIGFFIVLLFFNILNIYPYENFHSEIGWQHLNNAEKQLLESIQYNAFRYFWEEANPKNGLIQDRMTNKSVSSVASVGFGLSAICVAEKNGWIGKNEAYNRILTTLNSFYKDPKVIDDFVVEGENGFFYHFVDMTSGKRAWNSENSLIDSSILFAGMLQAGECFKGTEIEKMADKIYRNANWQSFLVEDKSMEHWYGYNEYILSYIMALGSPTYPIPMESFDRYVANYKWINYDNLTLLTPDGDNRFLAYLYQFPYNWFNWSILKDEKHSVDYYKNAQNALEANRRFCLINAKEFGYGLFWGWTASDGPSGYQGYGDPFNGTVAPSALIASISLIPDNVVPETVSLFQQYFEKIWGKYGFINAFNVKENWYALDYIGIDQGNIVLSIENFKNALIWNTFMSNKYIIDGLTKAGFSYIK